MGRWIWLSLLLVGEFVAGAQDICTLHPCHVSCTGPDCNNNGVVDACEVALGLEEDCNANRCADSAESIDCAGTCVFNCVAPSPNCVDVNDADADGDTTEACCNILVFGLQDDCLNDCSARCQLYCEDLDSNGVMDMCQGDCNRNGISDPRDISNGTSEDVIPFTQIGDPSNGDGIPDECCLQSGTCANPALSGDFNGDGKVDLIDLQFISICAGLNKVNAPYVGFSGQVAGSASSVILDPFTVECTGCQCACADLLPDGLINFYDLIRFRNLMTGPC